MIMRRLCFITLVVGLLMPLADPQPAQALSTAGTIWGKVFYSTTPMWGIKVELIPGNYTNPPIATTYSAQGGGYAFTNIPPGIYNVKIYAPTSEYEPWRSYEVAVPVSGLALDLYLVKLIKIDLPDPSSEVDSIHPVLCWNTLPEADHYIVVLTRASSGEMIEPAWNIRKNCYKTRNALEEGSSYEWKVTAMDAYLHEVGINEVRATFTIDTSPITTLAEPGSPAFILPRNRFISLTIPAGSVKKPVEFTYQRVNTPVDAPGLVDFDRTFTVTARYPDDSAPVEFVEGQGFYIPIFYRDGELGLIPEKSLALYYWDGTTWVKEPTSTVNTDRNMLTATPAHFGTWAVMGAEPKFMFLPQVSQHVR